MPRFLRRRALTCLVVLPVLVVMTACGAGASGSSARPSVTASLEPTRSFSPTRTLAPTLSPTPAAPAQSNDASAAPPPAPATDTSSGSGSAGKGWWWLLAVVLIMGGIAAVLLVRRRRGLHEWEDRFSAARDGVGWFARDLVPQLRRSGSPSGVVTGWSVAASRVAEIEDELSRLVATAPGDEQRARAVAVRDAVRESREQMAALAADAGRNWESGLADAQTRLLAALVPPASTAPHARPGA